MSEVPGFFKVFLLPKSSEEMLLPVALMDHLKGALPEQALLRNYYGEIWPVKIRKSGKKIFFTNGWAKFVKDNDVQNGDFLVFDYDGSYIFYIKLLGDNGCEKKIAKTSDFRVKEEKDEDWENNGLLELENEEDFPEEMEESDDETYEGKDEYEESDEDEDDTFEEENLRKKRGKGKSKKCAKKSKLVTLRSDEKFEGYSSDASDADEVFKFGKFSRPNTPYFVAKLRAKRTNELYIPLDVIRDHKLQLPKSINIVDELKREWTSEVKIWGDGRTWLTNGWSAFRKWNHLKWEDRCLCEFIRDPKKGLFLKIRILRAGSWFPKKNE